MFQVLLIAVFSGFSEKSGFIRLEFEFRINEFSGDFQARREESHNYNNSCCIAFYQHIQFLFIQYFWYNIFNTHPIFGL